MSSVRVSGEQFRHSNRDIGDSINCSKQRYSKYNSPDFLSCDSYDIPTFDGRNEHIDDFFDWMQSADYYFGYVDVEEEKQVRLVVCKLRGRAQAWWSQLVNKMKK